MIKFESVIFRKNYNNKQNHNHLLNKDGSDFVFYYSDLYKNGLTFTVHENKINFLNCNNNELLNDIFFIFTGFYKPELGNIIFDEYNINSFSLKQKADFISKNFAIISEFDVYELNKTLIDHLVLKLVCFGNKTKQALKEAELLLQSFELFEYRNLKLKQLEEIKILDYILLLITINNPKYVFIKGIERYFTNTDNKKYFFLNLEKFLKNQNDNAIDVIKKDLNVPFKTEQLAKTIILFSSQKINYYSKKTYELCVDNSNYNDVLVIRNKQYDLNNKHNKFFEQKNTNTFNLLKLMFKEKFFLLIIFLFSEIFLNLGTIYSYIGFNVNNNNGIIIAVFSFFVILNILFNIFAISILFDKFKSLIYNTIITGNYIFKIFSLFFYLLIYINLITTAIVTIYPIILYSTSTNDPFNITIFIFLLIFPYLISLFSCALIFAYRHKRIIRRLNEFI